MSQLQVAQFLYDLRQMLGELDSLPVPTIAALDGAALGGGLELALACDLRVASEFAFAPPAGGDVLTCGAVQALPPTSLDYQRLVLPSSLGELLLSCLQPVALAHGARSFSAGGTQRLSRLIGVSRAKDLIFTSKVLNAAQAHDLGT